MKQFERGAAICVNSFLHTVQKNLLLDVYQIKSDWRDPAGSAVLGVGLKPLDIWDCGFEPPESMNIRLLFWFCVFSEELFSRSEDSYRVCVSNSVCDLGTATVWRPRPDFGCCSTKKKLVSSALAQIFIQVYSILTKVRHIQNRNVRHL